MHKMDVAKDELIPTRASLLNRLQDWQDATSWREFFDIYWKLIYGVARKAGLTDAEAQDVVQETLISVAKHMPNFKYDPAIGSFKGWLLTMTRWRIVAHLRKRKPCVEPPPADDAGQTDFLESLPDPAAKSIVDSWDKEWEQQLLEAAISRIKRRVEPEKYQIFDFYVNQEWPPEKVAKRFNISVDQVYLIKHRITSSIKHEVTRLEKEMV